MKDPQVTLGYELPNYVAALPNYDFGTREPAHLENHLVLASQAYPRVFSEDLFTCPADRPESPEKNQEQHQRLLPFQ